MTPPYTQVFDTASLYFRAFYGLPASLRAHDGRPVNAVKGLLDFLARFISEYDPDRVACCWDEMWRPTWRAALVPSYKAHRIAVPADGVHPDIEDVPDELTAQIPLIVDVLTAAGLPIVGSPDMEADDVMATLATLAPGPIDVVTGDRDLFQLVDDARGVRVLYVAARGVRNHDRVTDAWLAKKYGVVGAQYADLATLRGDASDGLPGVRGIGEKTASSLLARFGDLDGIIESAAQLSPSVARSLAENADYLMNARDVVAVRRDAPLPDLDLSRPHAPADPDRFAALADELNLGGSAERFVQALAGTSGDTVGE